MARPLNPGYPGQEVLYKLGITPVARLSDRLGGTWFALLDYHLPGSKRVRDCASYDTGRQGVEMWAARHAERLRAEIDAQHEAWLKMQPWRPEEQAIGGRSTPAAGRDVPNIAGRPRSLSSSGWVDARDRSAGTLATDPRFERSTDRRIDRWKHSYGAKVTYREWVNRELLLPQIDAVCIRATNDRRCAERCLQECAAAACSV